MHDRRLPKADLIVITVCSPVAVLVHVPFVYHPAESCVCWTAPQATQDASVTVWPRPEPLPPAPVTGSRSVPCPPRLLRRGGGRH